jgi:RNA recognition motif-containing protein
VNRRTPYRGGSQESDGKTVFVKGFDPNNDEMRIRDVLTETFSKYGEVVEVRLPVDYDTQRVKGFGYVVFSEADGAPVRFGRLLM